MDAKRAPRWAWACCLITICGCIAPYPDPASRQENRPPEQGHEPPQVVDEQTVPEATASDDDLDNAVISFIERVDGAKERANRRDTRQPPPLPAGSVRQVADEEVHPASRPVEDQPTGESPQATDAQPTPASQQSVEPPPATQPGNVEPPVLVGVDVRAGQVHSPPTSGEPVTPAINATAVARGSPVDLRQFLEQMVPPVDATFREQLDLRLLWLAAGDYERAREPLKLVSAEQQELASRFIDAWIAIRAGHMGDLTAAANAAAKELAELQESLRRISDLSMPVLEICSAVRGFGQYDVIEPARFLAGGAGEFVLYCEISDFLSELRDDSLYYTTFDMTTTILSRAGDTVLEIKDTDIVDCCRNRRHDCFIPRLVRLPASLSPGQYVAKVSVVDKLGQKVAENRATFTLVVRP